MRNRTDRGCEVGNGGVASSTPGRTLRALVSAVSSLMVTGALLLVPAGSASATVLPTTITENTTLTPAGNPYTGNSTIASGVTVNVKAGVKFVGSSVTVKGTLNAEGTATEPVIFTGALEKSRGEWCTISFQAGSSASVIDHAEFKYGGGCNTGALGINEGASPTIKNSTVSQSWGYAIKVTEGGSPEIANNKVLGSDTYGIYYKAAFAQTGTVNIHDNYVEGGKNGIYVESTSTGSIVSKTLGGNTVVGTTESALFYRGRDIPGNITGNTLSGNTQNVIKLKEGTVAASSTWNNGGGPVKVEGTITIASGVTLNITKGVRLTGTPNMSVKGTLDVEGTAEEPVVFTSTAEKGRGEWCTIAFQAGSGASVIDHAEIKYGGGCNTGAIGINDGVSPTIINSTVSQSWGYAIKVTEGGSPEIADNAVLGSESYGIYYKAAFSQTGTVNVHGNNVEGGKNGIYVESTTTGSVVGKHLGGNTVVGTTESALFYRGRDIPDNITGNTLVANSQNYVKIKESTVARSSTWNNGGGPVKVEGTITVASGVTLSITKGVRLFGTPNMSVKGTLNVEGTAEEPVVFTGAQKKKEANGARSAFKPAAAPR